MMMAKMFRIERVQSAQPAGQAMAPAPLAKSQPEADGIVPVLKELRELRRLVEVQQRPVEPPPLDMAITQRLRTEIEAMHLAIEQTKREIATLHVNGFKGPQMARVTGELDAVVSGTLAATDEILTAAETIERAAGVLQAHCRNRQDRELAAEVADQVVRIYESCNFQDLTGQRITKVVGTLAFIEERVMGMMAIWGGLENFEGLVHEPAAAPEGDASLLNGPKLSADAGHVNQDDIDALFG